MNSLTTAYKKRDNKFGARNIEKSLGSAIFGAPDKKWKEFEYYRKKGVEPDAEGKIAENEILQASAMCFVPMRQDSAGKAQAITGTVPLTLGDRTYDVGPEGIRLINEDVFGDIVEKSLERKEYYDDVTELILINGDTGLKALSPVIYGLCVTATCKPSEIKLSAGTKDFGAKLLKLQSIVEANIDKVAIPSSILKKVHGRTRASGVDTTKISN